MYDLEAREMHVLGFETNFVGLYRAVLVPIVVVFVVIIVVFIIIVVVFVIIVVIIIIIVVIVFVRLLTIVVIVVFVIRLLTIVVIVIIGLVTIVAVFVIGPVVIVGHLSVIVVVVIAVGMNVTGTQVGIVETVRVNGVGEAKLNASRRNGTDKGVVRVVAAFLLDARHGVGVAVGPGQADRVVDIVFAARAVSAGLALPVVGAIIRVHIAVQRGIVVGDFQLGIRRAGHGELVAVVEPAMDASLLQCMFGNSGNFVGFHVL